MPHEELQAIESIVAAHPEGIGAQAIGRELDRKVPRRTLQYRLKYLVDAQRLVRQGERRWATYRQPAAYPTWRTEIGAVRENNGDYVSDPLATKGEVLVYEAAGGDIRVEVRLERDTVWLTQQQMADLFDSSVDNIGLHLRNIFFDNELDEGATTEDFSVVRKEGERRVRRNLKHYNLDAIISVGYRVHSRRGVRFRQWATRTLREHLVRGYTLNERRLAERGLDEARTTLDLLARTLQNQALVNETGRAVLEVIGRYADTWRLLLEYDENRLALPPGARPSTGVLDVERVTRAIAEFKQELAARGEASALFGNPRGEALDGILGSIEQTMFGERNTATRTLRATPFSEWDGAKVRIPLEDNAIVTARGVEWLYPARSPCRRH